MKKLLGIIIFLLIIIIIISVAFYTYVKNNNSCNNEILIPPSKSSVDEPEPVKEQNLISKTETEPQRIQANVEFNDNECLAIGYVTDLNEVRFIEKYFTNETYGQMSYFDFREPIYQNDSSYGNKFVIVPKNENVNITVYDCYIGEDGELYTDNTLIQKISEPFIVIDDYIEYTPIMCVKFEYNGFEEMFPILFSGEDGTLVLTGYEMEVKDISLY